MTKLYKYHSYHSPATFRSREEGIVTMRLVFWLKKWKPPYLSTQHFSQLLSYNLHLQIVEASYRYSFLRRPLKVTSRDSPTA